MRNRDDSTGAWDERNEATARGERARRNGESAGFVLERVMGVEPTTFSLGS